MHADDKLVFAFLILLCMNILMVTNKPEELKYKMILHALIRNLIICLTFSKREIDYQCAVG